MRQGSTYYVFSTDIPGQQPGNLPIRCSQDEVNWTACGSVFAQIPSWVGAAVPGIGGLWAPDISFFNGLYHLYYAGSMLGSQQSVIGLATNTTLDRSDPAYKWIDRGEVLGSVVGDDFDAIDPNILADSSGSIWLTYGSYWSGIKQLQIEPATGMPVTNFTRYNLATRPEVADDAIEGASLVQHGGYYYLFVSIDHCCTANITTDNYKEAVGRSTNPNGPFADINGTAMMNGGGTVLLQGDGTWNAPGGGTVYIDSTGEGTIVFHAINMSQSGTPYLWLKQITWVNDWPAVVTSPASAALPSS